MIPSRKTFVATACCLLASHGAMAATVLSYDIAAVTNPSSVPVGTTASGVSATSITTGPALSRVSFWDGTTGLFGATGFSVSSTPTAGAYFEFSISAAPGKQISFDSLTYGLVREIRVTGGSFRGPESWQLVYSLDHFATAGTVLDTLTVPDSGVSDTLNQKTFTSNLAAIGTQTGTVSFRWLGYGSAGFTNFYLGGLGNGSGGGIGRDGLRSWAGTGSNVVLDGTVSDVSAPTVPEPSSLLLVALGAGAGLGVTRARRGHELG